MFYNRRTADLRIQRYQDAKEVFRFLNNITQYAQKDNLNIFATMLIEKIKEIKTDSEFSYPFLKRLYGACNVPFYIKIEEAYPYIMKVNLKNLKRSIKRLKKEVERQFSNSIFALTSYAENYDKCKTDPLLKQESIDYRKARNFYYSNKCEVDGFMSIVSYRSPLF